MEKLPFYVKKQIYYVNIIRTNNKNMYLKIQNQQIIVSVPQQTSLKVASLFVNQHIEKFVTHLEASHAIKMLDFDQKYVYIQGKKYDIKILTGFTKTSVEIKNDVVYLKVNFGQINELILTLNKYLRKLLLDYLAIKILYYEKLMNLPVHSFRVVNKQSNWGSNVIGQQNLSFALKLIHYQSATIDYVIVHELAHDSEPNHSANFWTIVKQFFPNYLIENKKLKNLN